jgi:hypothetical protein
MDPLRERLAVVDVARDHTLKQLSSPCPYFPSFSLILIAAQALPGLIFLCFYRDGTSEKTAS